MECVILTNKYNNQTNELLRHACRQRDIQYRPLDVPEVNFCDVPHLAPGTMLYRVATQWKYMVLEQMLLHPKVATLYKTATHYPRYASLQEQKAGLPIPRTVFYVNREYLDQYIDYVGGFPMIIKIMGRSHGVGVIRIDSREALVSTLDYLETTKEYYVLREFIRAKKSARLVVLGDRVIASAEYDIIPGDFRTNASETATAHAQTFSKAIQQTAVKAVHTLRLENGGVDILINDQGHYVIEVNFPCFFTRTQQVTGIDIAGSILDYLVAKSKRLK